MRAFYMNFNYLSVVLAPIDSALANAAAMSPPRAPPLVAQDTELVFIDSSPIQLAHLPRPRVLKRKESHFMLRRSPTSPTLDIRSQAGLRTFKSPEKQTTRSKRDYISVNGK